MIDENLDSEHHDQDLEDATHCSPDDDLHGVHRRTILKSLAALALVRSPSVGRWPRRRPPRGRSRRK